ncbi:MAG: type VII secretion protein EccE [Mycobacterium sp.]|nr:type VII secretion protein EccE [Mycobacterium sp.]
MKAQPGLALSLPWRRVTAVFLIDVAVLAIASHCPDAWQKNHAAWWVGVGVAAVITIATLVTARGIPLAWIPVERVRNWYANPEGLLVACTQPIDHQRRFGRDVVGIREYGGRLVTVIAVAGTAGAALPSGRHHQQGISGAALPIEAVGAALRQFDVRLDGVDIVSVATHSDQSTWLVLRMDPQHNVAAVAARDSLAATLAAATERLAHDIDGQHCQARPLKAAEITDMDGAVLAGLEVDRIRPHWRHLEHPDGYVASSWVSPRDITGKLLDELELSEADVTVLTIRLVTRPGGIDVSAFVRYHSKDRLPKSLLRGLNRLTGRQLDALRASLPAPAAGRPLLMSSRELGENEPILIRLGEAAIATPEYSPELARMAR